jgi:hypothetical protein
MRRDRQNRHSTPLTVIKTVDEMKVTRSTASGAHGQFTGDVRLGTGRKGCNLFVSYWYPGNGFPFSECLRNAIQGISHYAINTANTSHL